MYCWEYEYISVTLTDATLLHPSVERRNACPRNVPPQPPPPPKQKLISHKDFMQFLPKNFSPQTLERGTRFRFTSVSLYFDQMQVNLQFTFFADNARNAIQQIMHVGKIHISFHLADRPSSSSRSLSSSVYCIINICINGHFFLVIVLRCKRYNNYFNRT